MSSTRTQSQLVQLLQFHRLLSVTFHVSPLCPLLNTDHIFEKKISLVVFRHKFVPYLKRLLENCYLKIVSSFWSLTLHTVNFLLWKKIMTVSRPTTFRIFLMGRPGCPTKWGNWGQGFPRKLKSLNFPLLLDKNITYWEVPRIGKKRYLYSF